MSSSSNSNSANSDHQIQNQNNKHHQHQHQYLAKGPRPLEFKGLKEVGSPPDSSESDGVKNQYNGTTSYSVTVTGAGLGGGPLNNNGPDPPSLSPGPRPPVGPGHGTVPSKKFLKQQYPKQQLKQGSSQLQQSQYLNSNSSASASGYNSREHTATYTTPTSGNESSTEGNTQQQQQSQMIMSPKGLIRVDETWKGNQQQYYQGKTTIPPLIHEYNSTYNPPLIHEYNSTYNNPRSQYQNQIPKNYYQVSNDYEGGQQDSKSSQSSQSHGSLRSGGYLQSESKSSISSDTKIRHLLDELLIEYERLQSVRKYSDQMYQTNLTQEANSADPRLNVNDLRRRGPNDSQESLNRRIILFLENMKSSTGKNYKSRRTVEHDNNQPGSSNRLDDSYTNYRQQQQFSSAEQEQHNSTDSDSNNDQHYDTLLSQIDTILSSIDKNNKGPRSIKIHDKIQSPPPPSDIDYLPSKGKYAEPQYYDNNQYGYSQQAQYGKNQNDHKDRGSDDSQYDQYYLNSNQKGPGSSTATSSSQNHGKYHRVQAGPDDQQVPSAKSARDRIASYATSQYQKNIPPGRPQSGTAYADTITEYDTSYNHGGPQYHHYHQYPSEYYYPPGPPGPHISNTTATISKHNNLKGPSMYNEKGPSQQIIPYHHSNRQHLSERRGGANAAFGPGQYGHYGQGLGQLGSGSSDSYHNINIRSSDGSANSSGNMAIQTRFSTSNIPRGLLQLNPLDYTSRAQFLVECTYRFAKAQPNERVEQLQSYFASVGYSENSPTENNNAQNQNQNNQVSTVNNINDNNDVNIDTTTSSANLAQDLNFFTTEVLPGLKVIPGIHPAEQNLLPAPVCPCKDFDKYEEDGSTTSQATGAGSNTSVNDPWPALTKFQKHRLGLCSPCYFKLKRNGCQRGQLECPYCHYCSAARTVIVDRWKKKRNPFAPRGIGFWDDDQNPCEEAIESLYRVYLSKKKILVPSKEYERDIERIGEWKKIEERERRGIENIEVGLEKWKKKEMMTMVEGSRMGEDEGRGGGIEG